MQFYGPDFLEPLEPLILELFRIGKVLLVAEQFHSRVIVIHERRLAVNLDIESVSTSLSDCSQ